jgi:hypothetical protein
MSLIIFFKKILWNAVRGQPHVRADYTVVWFQTSAAKNMSIALFRAITQWGVVNSMPKFRDNLSVTKRR